MSRAGRVAQIGLVLAAVAIPWWGPRLLRPLAFFAVRRVEVVGTRYLSPVAVVAALALTRESSVWDDLGRLESRLKAMGGVSGARVSRYLPGTLRVAVKEIEPVALAEGPEGLVPVGRDGRPLPYDPRAAPVDAPVVARPEEPVVAALAVVQATDLGFYAEVSAARLARGGEVVLELNEGWVRLGTPVDPAAVRSVSAVRRDLLARRVAWGELDARYKGWVIVRPRRAAGAG